MGRLKKRYDLNIKWGIDGKNIQSQKKSVIHRIQEQFAVLIGQTLDITSEPTYKRYKEEFMRIMKPIFPEITEKTAHMWFHRVVENNCDAVGCTCIKEER